MAKKGEAFAEFMRNIDKVKISLEYHHVMRFAYNELNQNSVITCTYTNFTKLCNKHIYKTESKSKVIPTHAVKNDSPAIREPQQTEQSQQPKLGQSSFNKTPEHQGVVTDEIEKKLF